MTELKPPYIDLPFIWAKKHALDFWKYCVSGILSTVVGVVASIALIDYVGWSAKKYNLIIIIPITVFRYATLKWFKFNK